MIINNIHLDYLTEDEVIINEYMIPVIENSRLGLYIVRLKDLDKLQEEYKCSLAKIARANNICENKLAVSMKDEDLILSNLNEEIRNIVIEPTYSKYYTDIMNNIENFIESGGTIPLLLESNNDDPLPYLNSAKNIKNDVKNIRKNVIKDIVKSKYTKAAIGAAGVYYANKKVKEKTDKNIVALLKEKISALKMAYKIYNDEYDLNTKMHYTSPSLIKRILESIKEKINRLIMKLKSFIKNI